MGKSYLQPHDDFSARSLRTTLNPGTAINQARIALRQFRYEEAIRHCQTLLQTSGLASDEEASVRCLLAETWEALSNFTEAVQSLQVYEEEGQRRQLSLALQCQVSLRLGAAYGGTKEIPKALSWARQALDQSERYGDPGKVGECQLLLGTLYRRLGETHFAQEHYAQSHALALRHGDDLLQAKALNGFGMVFLTESDWAEAERAFEQARALLPEGDAPLLRGSLLINQAIGPQLQGQWRTSVALLEQAIPPLQEARQPRLLANAYSNLGYSLLRLGAMSRAQEALQHALREARHCEAFLVEASALESLGELHYVQGRCEEGEHFLQKSLEILRILRVGFNEAQFYITQGRCQLLANNPAEALVAFQTSAEISERMSDPRGLATAELWQIEALLANGQQPDARQRLSQIRNEIERLALAPLLAHLKELSGHLALQTQEATEAIKYFGRAISIWEMLEEPFRAAVAWFHLGQAYSHTEQAPQARQALDKAQSLFEQLGATSFLTRIAKVRKGIPVQSATPLPRQERDALIVSALTRLHETGGVRALLLREFLSILHDDFAATPVIIFQRRTGHDWLPLLYQGCQERQAKLLLHVVTNDEKRTALQSLYPLQTGQDEQLVLYLGKSGAALTDSLLALLIREVEAGLERDRRPPRNTRPLAVTPAGMLPAHPSLPGLVYRSEAMRKIVEQIYNLRTSDIPILITGETGTGKDLIARAIHTLSGRSAHPFIPFNCAATPRELVESQLFGHRHGAFTGARTDFPGLIGAAEKGTLFLDEIGELAREVQPKLLRFLQDGEIQRLGETKPRRANVRVIAATNRDLKSMVDAGEFRADLYYRLNVVQLSLPPLRERRDEIPLLIDYFLQRYAKLADKQKITLAPGVSELLRQYDWPGNARQLENEIQRLVALTPPGERITAAALSPDIGQPMHLQLVTRTPRDLAPRTLGERLAETERQIIRDALVRHNGNLSRVAGELGVSRNGLRKMLTRLQLNRNGTPD